MISIELSQVNRSFNTTQTWKHLVSLPNISIKGPLAACLCSGCPWDRSETPKKTVPLLFEALPIQRPG